jgi:hypothetical protein
MGALTLSTSLLLSPGCKPKPNTAASQTALAPFTAKLTEIEGVQAIYTLRHPKLILADLDKLMAEVPEASLARMFLGQLTPYGYPEFSEIAAGSNVGVVMLEVTPEEIETGSPTLVGFAKLKENGKIWTALVQSGLAVEKRGEWTLIAQDASSFAKIKVPAAITAHLDQPQTEEVRAWGRVSPALLAKAKTAVFSKLETSLASRSAAEQKAIAAYADVVWGYLSQIHSLGGFLDLNDQGIAFGYSGQFQPESSLGVLLRHAPGPEPKIAKSVPADGLMSVVIRQNIPAQMTFVNGLFDALIAVDYPAGAEALRTAKAGYLSLTKNGDGGAVMTMSMNLPKGTQAPEVTMFGVNSGNFAEADVLAGYKATADLSQKFTTAILASVSSLAPGSPKPEVRQQLTENALTIDGTRFGSLITTTKVSGEDELTTSTTQYFGVVGGNLVYATSEAALREKLPALGSKRDVPNPVKLSFANDEIMVMALNGEKIVDMVVASAGVDLTDADIQAQIQTLKQGYASADPVKMTVSGSQAKAAINIFVPYKFISQSTRLGQFAVANKAAESTPASTMPATTEEAE